MTRASSVAPGDSSIRCTSVSVSVSVTKRWPSCSSRLRSTSAFSMMPLCTGTIALVHNGIIENADVLRKRLEQDGHRFVTETDTETLVHLIEESPGATLEARVIAALDHVEGTYGIAVVAEADRGKIVVARRGSPVLLGVGDGEFLIASDASAVLGHTRSVVYLNDG